MTEKEVTNIVYGLMNYANLIEIKIINGKEFSIFKDSSRDYYMVCFLDPSNSYHSPILDSIISCYNWIIQNP